MSYPESTSVPVNAEPVNEDSLIPVLAKLWQYRWALVAGPLLMAVLAIGLSYLFAPGFTARASLLPPQMQQSAAANALSSLGSLAGGLPGGAASLRTPAELQSSTVRDRMVERFDLMKVYDKELRTDARRVLAESSRFALGRRDGIISIEVDDASPSRAAEMANQYIEELRRLTSQIAVTEAQQRRAFFDEQLKQARDRLAAAQAALQGSGYSRAVLRAEPRAAAEAYARLRAETAAAEVALRALRTRLADGAPEVVQQQSQVNSLRTQLAKAEASAEPASASADYIGKFREFKYQETLFDLFARQYEQARVDESREGALIQVIDKALPPERKSSPSRTNFALGGFALGALAMLAFVFGRDGWRAVRAAVRMKETQQDPANVGGIR
jgi:uncharacterized protein involved in exopolysaccharide biosynthesis